MATATEEYQKTLRTKILSRLQDLKEKIETNESCPEKEQDIDLLVEIDDGLDTLLNNWYY